MPLVQDRLPGGKIDGETQFGPARICTARRHGCACLLAVRRVFPAQRPAHRSNREAARGTARRQRRLPPVDRNSGHDHPLRDLGPGGPAARKRARPAWGREDHRPRPRRPRLLQGGDPGLLRQAALRRRPEGRDGDVTGQGPDGPGRPAAGRCATRRVRSRPQRQPAFPPGERRRHPGRPSGGRHRFPRPTRAQGAWPGCAGVGDPERDAGGGGAAVRPGDPVPPDERAHRLRPGIAPGGRFHHARLRRRWPQPQDRLDAAAAGRDPPQPLQPLSDPGDAGPARRRRHPHRPRPSGHPKPAEEPRARRSPGLPRLPHRSGESGAAGRAAGERAARDRAQRRRLRRPLPGPGPIQGGQRHLRPCRGRPTDPRRGQSAQERMSVERYDRAAGRGRVRHRHAGGLAGGGGLAGEANRRSDLRVGRADVGPRAPVLLDRRGGDQRSPDRAAGGAPPGRPRPLSRQDAGPQPLLFFRAGDGRGGQIQEGAGGRPAPSDRRRRPGRRLPAHRRGGRRDGRRGGLGALDRPGARARAAQRLPSAEESPCCRHRGPA